jgi:hypothetical protein
MQLNWKSYDESLSEWATEKAYARANTIIDNFQAFEKLWKGQSSQDEGIVLDSACLRHATFSYFLDIGRLKLFHGIERADRHKVAAYSLKWLIKLRPIVASTPGFSSRKLALANEVFGLWVAVSYLNVRYDRIPDKIKEIFLYHLRYRPFEADSWAIIFYFSENGFLPMPAPPVTSGSPATMA